MLTKRTNVLFEEEKWQRLLALATEFDTSAGELIRKAVEEKYFKNNHREKIAKAVQKILSIRKKYKKINYHQLINYGRKL